MRDLQPFLLHFSYWTVSEVLKNYLCSSPLWAQKEAQHKLKAEFYLLQNS